MVNKQRTKFLKDIKKNALHNQLNIRVGLKIPKSILEAIARTRVGTYIIILGEKVKVTRLLKQRAIFALNASTWRTR